MAEFRIVKENDGLYFVQYLIEEIEGTTVRFKWKILGRTASMNLAVKEIEKFKKIKEYSKCESQCDYYDSF